ncbi:uncharacterized protein TNCV_705491 [Trichonephila clavipes]|nr:uncharacterized protein TNCV_705491 [Trichonephila clavipes]
MPKRIVVGCVDNDSFHGTFEKSPFDFKHYDINFIGVYVDGQPTPHNPLDLNFAQNNYIKGYHSLFSGTEKLGQDQAARGLLAKDHVILNQVTWTTPELAPLLTTTPHQREDVSALDRFNVHCCPTRRVFSGTGLEPVTVTASHGPIPIPPATAATNLITKLKEQV